MTTTTTQPASVIMAMHARFEQANAEYDRIDTALTAVHVASEHLTSRGLQLSRAMSDNQAECDALRLSILRQAPDSATDALILQYHIWLSHDMLENATDAITAQERAALSAAIDTMFDFLACETPGDHDGIGQAFRQGHKLARSNRRFRTGELEA